MSPWKNIPPNRRQFFKLLAGSPLLAAAYPVLPEGLKQLVTHAHAADAATATVKGKTKICPECGQPFIGDPGYYGRSAAQPEYPYNLITSVDEAVNVWDFEKVLYANNLPEHWNYLRGGVDDDATVIANRLGYQRLQLSMPRLKRSGGTGQTTGGADAEEAQTARTGQAAPAPAPTPTPTNRAAGGLDTSVEIFGRRWRSPLFICPVGSLKAYNTEADVGVAQAAKNKNQLMIESTVSSDSYEDIAAARGEPHWFQLYADRDFTKTTRMLKRVEEQGCPTVVWTIDLLGGSNRETLRRSNGPDGTEKELCQECHQHASDYEKPMRAGLEGLGAPRMTNFDWDYVKRLKDTTSMKVVLKGIVREDEAAMAVETGADAVYVSNHGGRAEESLRSTIEELPGVVRGAAGRVPIFIDSGVRRGTDIFKAVALGATAVGIGRPYVWGLGAFGSEGVEKVIELLEAELAIPMRQGGAQTLKEIDKKWLVDRSATTISNAISQR